MIFIETQIKIIDSIMGSGKTSWGIQKMIEDTGNNYVYITPFLTEVQRIKDQCKDRKFYEPLNKGLGKLDSLHKLLLENKNIASTHALFKMSNDITKDLIKANNYVLILDEVMDVIEEVPLRKDDLKILTETHLITIREDGLVIWNEDKMDYQTQYDDIKTMCLNNSLFMVNNVLLMWTFPVDIFKSFKEVYVMSYLFDAQIQRYYYDLYNLEYTYYHVVNENGKYILKPKNSIYKEDKSELRTRINILEDTINNIGDKDFSLSVSWYEKDKNKVLINQLKNNLYNFLRNKVNAKSKDILWTTYKKYENKLAGNGYSKAFIPINSRATNLYKDRHNLAYCVNIFLNPILKQFFTDRNITVKENTYALSEMLQWIWRSAIRENENINIYIPSARMRDLLKQWLSN